MIEPTNTRPSVRPERRARDDAPLRDLVQRIGHALIEGDTHAMARMWNVPSIAVSDRGVRVVLTPESTERFFRGEHQHHAARGIIETLPDIQRVDWMTDRIVEVSVRWPHEDVHGHDLGAELIRYTLRQDDAGEWKICAAVARGSSH